MANVTKFSNSFTKYITDLKRKSVLAVDEIVEERRKRMEAISPVDT